MSPDNPTQILTTNDLSHLRTLHSVPWPTVVPVSIQPINNVTNGLRMINTVAQQQQQLVYSSSIGFSINNGHIVGDGSIQKCLSNSKCHQTISTTTTTITSATRVGSYTDKNISNNTINNTNNNHNSNNNHTSHLTFSSGTIVPTISKYVLLQQNRRDQFTSYDSIVSSDDNRIIPPTGSIVVLAAEPLENMINHNQRNNDVSIATVITAGVDNNEELRSLAWLNNSNLIKNIVTSATTTSNTNDSAIQESIATRVINNNNDNNNNSIVSAAPSSGTVTSINRLTIGNDLIKELTSPQSRQITAVGSLNCNGNGSNNDKNNEAQQQNTTLPVTLNSNNFQRQFKQFKRFNDLELKDQPVLRRNIAQLGPATMYVSSNGSTTVLEYDTAANLPTSEPLLNSTDLENTSRSNKGICTSIFATMKTKNCNNSSSSSSSFVPLSSTLAVANNNNDNSDNNTNSNSETLIIPNSECNVNNIIVTAAPTIETTSATVIKTKGTGCEQHLMLPNRMSILINGNSLTSKSNSNDNDNNNNNRNYNNNNGQVSNIDNHNRTNNNNNQLNSDNYHVHKSQQECSLTSFTMSGSVGNHSSNNNSIITVSSNNNSTNSNTTNCSNSSATHHPHKKYLREKMNSLDKENGSDWNNDICNGIEISQIGLDISNSTNTATVLSSGNIPSNVSSCNASTNSNKLILNGSNSYKTIVTSCGSLLNTGGSAITILSSPASSNSSLSTAAVNGGNSPPLSKTSSFFTLSASNAPTTLYHPSGNIDIRATTTASMTTTTKTLNITPFISTTISNINNSSIPFLSSSHELASTSASINTSPAKSFINYSNIMSNQIPEGFTITSQLTPTTNVSNVNSLQHHHKPQLSNHNHHHDHRILESIPSIATITKPTTTRSSGKVQTVSALQQKEQNATISVPSSSPTIALKNFQHNTKEYFIVNTPSQQQQYQELRSSPASHSSNENDSVKDFEIIRDTQINYQHHNRNNNDIINVHSTTLQHNNLTISKQRKQQQRQPHTNVETASNNSNNGNVPGTSQKQKHPNNIPYDPLLHTHNKPPYSFSSLIFMAIESSQEKALPVKEIYAWIVHHFPYFKTAPTGWKNSVRHNLSLNKSFVKVEKAPNMGKGSLWRVEPQQKQILLQALNRSPFFQNTASNNRVDTNHFDNGCSGNNITITSSSVDLNSYDVVDGDTNSNTKALNSISTISPTIALINSRFDPILFPHLTKAFKDINDVASDVPDNENSPDFNSTVIAPVAAAITTETNNNQTSLSVSNQNHKYNNITYLIKNIDNTSNNNHKQHQNDHNNIKVINKIDSNVNSITNDNDISRTSPIHLNTLNHYDNIKRFARDYGADSIDDINAATAMLALKHGSKMFAESLHNGAPVITSSPSEDHTYSAGGKGNSNGAASTSVINGSLTNGCEGSGDKTKEFKIQIVSADNQSNCACADKPYENSDECPDVSVEELEDRKRHRDGVDALLSLSLCSTIETVVSNNKNSQITCSQSSISPNKRPSTTTIEEERHISTIINNHSNKISKNNSSNNHTYHIVQPHNMNKIALLSTLSASNNNSNNNNNAKSPNNHSNTRVLSKQLLPNNRNTNPTLHESYNSTSKYLGNHPIIPIGMEDGNNHQQQYQHHSNNVQIQQQSQQHYRGYASHHSGGGSSCSNSNSSSSISMYSNATITTSVVVEDGVKKSKPLISLRSKIRRKTPWMR